MANHQILDNIAHKDIKIITRHSPEFGDNTSYTNLFNGEFRHAQSFYPIMFRKNTETAAFETIALFGFGEQENLFLSDNGWDARYIPLTIQRRPFLIGFQETNDMGEVSTKPVVTIDMDSPRVSTTEGKNVFLEHGGQSDYLQHISKVLGAIHEGHEQAKQFIDSLLANDLIESVEIKVTLNDGSQHSVNSLYALNEEKVASLSGELLSEFHKKGYIQDMHMIMASMANMTKLIDRKNQSV